MATIGLPSLAESVKVFRMENDDHEIEIAGLVFNHASYSQERPEVQRSITEIRELAEEHGWHIFSNRIRLLCILRNGRTNRDSLGAYNSRSLYRHRGIRRGQG